MRVGRGLEGGAGEGWSGGERICTVRDVLLSYVTVM